MKRIFAGSILFCAALFCTEALAAFIIPYLHNSSEFCRVQPRFYEGNTSTIGDEYRPDLYSIDIIENFSSIDLSYIFYAIFNNGKKERGFFGNQIYFGYTDGENLFGWSINRLRYYKLTERTRVAGNPSVIEECEKILNQKPA